MTNKKTLPTGFKPYGTVARQHEPPPPPPDWNLWGSMYDVELWQAAALSLNINPDSIKDPDSFNFGEYKVRLLLLENWLPSQKRIMLCELAGKWSKVHKWQIPPELAALARFYDALTNKEANAPAAKVEAETDTSPSDEDMEEHPPSANDHVETLAALFDPLPVAALEKMFPTNGKWKSWAEKAATNGLINARTKRAMFNPYKAAVWFISKGVKDWDLARCNRVLANNLPARSVDSKYMLTGDID